MVVIIVEKKEHLQNVPKGSAVRFGSKRFNSKSKYEFNALPEWMRVFFAGAEWVDISRIAMVVAVDLGKQEIQAVFVHRPPLDTLGVPKLSGKMEVLGDKKPIAFSKPENSVNFEEWSRKIVHYVGEAVSQKGKEALDDTRLFLMREEIICAGT